MNEDTVRVRVVGRQFRHDGEEYLQGDELEVSERAIDGWESRLERVEADEEAADAADAEDETPEEGEGDFADLDPHPRDLSVADLEERLADVDDPDLLERIRDAEAVRDDPRSTAIDAIEDRLNDVTSE